MRWRSFGRGSCRCTSRSSRERSRSASRSDRTKRRSARRDGTAAIDEHAVCRRAECRSPVQRERADVVGDRHRRAAPFEAGGVERLGEQRALPDEKDVPGGVQRARIGLEQMLGLRRTNQPDPDRGLWRLHPEQKMTTVREKCRIRMCDLPACGIRCRNRRRSTPPFADTVRSPSSIFEAKTIVPFAPQDAPPDCGASQIACGDPPSTSTRSSFPSAKNPTERESGDQNGKAGERVSVLTVVSLSGRASSIRTSAPRDWERLHRRGERRTRVECHPVTRRETVRRVHHVGQTPRLPAARA